MHGTYNIKLQISITFISYFGNRTGSCGFGNESAVEGSDLDEGISALTRL